MKVLHINCNYVGTTLHQKMIEKLDEKSVENKVFVPVYSKDIAVIKVNENVIVAECFKKWDRIWFDYKQKKIRKALEHVVNVKEFDILHAYTLFTDGNIALQMKKEYGIPYVVAVRNTDVNSFFRYRVNLRKRGVEILREAEAVFFLSSTYKQQVLEKYVPQNVREEIERKSKIIPNGIDDYWIKNVPEAKTGDSQRKEVNIIYAGRIDKNKNITSTQKALGILRKDGYDVRFTVVGKVADKQLFRRIERDRYTKYISAQPKEKLIGLYRKNDIFVMPSFQESFGLVYAEAMSQGLPVVYTRGQGFDGQFPEGTVGHSVAADAPREIADAIADILENMNRYSENAIAGSRKFQWDEITDGYLRIYEEIYRRQENII